MEQELLEIKKKIEEARTNEAKLEGQYSQLLKQLQDDFNCNTIEEAEEFLSEINGKIKEKEQSLEKGIQDLKNKLGW